MSDLPKSKIYRRFSLFGWNIYITRHSLRRKVNRSRFRTSSKVKRLIASENHCELCGRHININCSLFHILPKGHPRRNEVANVRVLCPECLHFVQSVGAYRPMISKEGGEL